MPHLDHTAFVNSRRDERSLGHYTLRAYAQDLRTFTRFTKAHHLSDPLSKDDILAYHRHLRDELCARPATIERRLVTLKSYYAWREDRNSALPSPIRRRPYLCKDPAPPAAPLRPRDAPSGSRVRQE